MEHLALILARVVINETATIDGLTVLSLFHENVSMVSASHSRVVHVSRTWLHLA